MKLVFVLAVLALSGCNFEFEDENTRNYPALVMEQLVERTVTGNFPKEFPIVFWPAGKSRLQTKMVRLDERWWKSDAHCLLIRVHMRTGETDDPVPVNPQICTYGGVKFTRASVMDLTHFLSVYVYERVKRVFQ